MSFFRYPGGKSKLRNEISMILAQQANHQGLQYREPFFGGGSIGLKLLNDNPDITNIWINDKDIGIACLWTSVIRYPDEFKEHVKNFNPSIEVFYNLKQKLPLLITMPKQKNDIVDIGFKKLVIHQISYSGLGTKSGGPLGGRKQKSKYKINCRWSPEYICKKIDKLHHKFSNISICNNACTNLDFEDVIISNTNDSLIYLDPPYYVKGNELYQHGFKKEDHYRLAELLRNSNHSWVLSYDDCVEIRDIYSWAYFHSLNVKYSINSTKEKYIGNRVSTEKSELLIYPRKGKENLQCYKINSPTIE